MVSFLVYFWQIFVLISSEKYSYAILYESLVSNTNKTENHRLILQTTAKPHNM
jgi:hypothetical protein